MEFIDGDKDKLKQVLSLKYFFNGHFSVILSVIHSVRSEPRSIRGVDSTPRSLTRKCIYIHTMVSFVIWSVYQPGYFMES